MAYASTISTRTNELCNRIARTCLGATPLLRVDAEPAAAPLALETLQSWQSELQLLSRALRSEQNRLDLERGRAQGLPRHSRYSAAQRLQAHGDRTDASLANANQALARILPFLLVADRKEPNKVLQVLDRLDEFKDFGDGLFSKSDVQAAKDVISSIGTPGASLSAAVHRDFMPDLATAVVTLTVLIRVLVLVRMRRLASDSP